MVDVFEVVTFDYLVKPISSDKIKAVVDKARSYLNMTKRSFSFSYRRNCYNLKFEDILYLEKKGRSVYIYSESEAYQANMNLAEIWEQLDAHMFATIHGSFIVNLEHVLSFSGGMVTLNDGTKLVVTRGYRKEFAEKFITFVRGGM